MDAALDAMSLLGFPNKCVRQTVKELLKVGFFLKQIFFPPFFLWGFCSFLTYEMVLCFVGFFLYLIFFNFFRYMEEMMDGSSLKKLLTNS